MKKLAASIVLPYVQLDTEQQVSSSNSLCLCILFAGRRLGIHLRKNRERRTHRRTNNKVRILLNQLCPTLLLGVRTGQVKTLRKVEDASRSKRKGPRLVAESGRIEDVGEIQQVHLKACQLP